MLSVWIPASDKAYLVPVKPGITAKYAVMRIPEINRLMAFWCVIVCAGKTMAVYFGMEPV